MPIPKPSSGETETDYISRCMEAQSGESIEQEQKLAICYAKYREGGAQKADAVFRYKGKTPEQMSKAELLEALMAQKKILQEIIINGV